MLEIKFYGLRCYFLRKDLSLCLLILLILDRLINFEELLFLFLFYSFSLALIFLLPHVYHLLRLFLHILRNIYRDLIFLLPRNLLVFPRFFLSFHSQSILAVLSCLHRRKIWDIFYFLCFHFLI